jgi:hypothetical protein
MAEACSGGAIWYFGPIILHACKTPQPGFDKQSLWCFTLQGVAFDFA